MNSSPFALEKNPYQPFWLAVLKSAGFVLLFFGCVFAANFAGAVFALARSGPTLSPAELESELLSLTYEMMFLGAGLFILVVFLIYLFSRRRFSDATGVRSAPLLSLPTALFLGFGAFFIAIWLMELLHLIPAVRQSSEDYSQLIDTIDTAIAQRGRPWVDVLYTVIGAPVAEELLCRGLVLRQLRRAASDWGAIVLAAVVFAVIHGNIFQSSFTLPLGILLGYVAVLSDSVFPAMLIHAVFNGSNYLLGLRKTLGLTDKSGVWVDGAVIAFFLLSLILGAVLLYFYARRRPAPSGGLLRTPPPGSPDLFFQTEGTDMAAPEYLIAGLGNPGEKYASTRHNAGFIALDYIALREGMDLSRIRFHALTGEKEWDGHKVLFLKPQTFMNLSGQSVREAAAFYHIPPEKILILVDDVNFEPGVLRIRREGSAGGHNGIKSIIENLGTEAFPRIRLGVGHLPPERDLVSWVLSALPDGDMDKLISTLEDVRKAARFFVNGDLDGAMSAFNGKRAGD